jgi:hypothetical protein
MATKTPQKNIDDIADVTEMVELFKLLHIDHNRENLNLKEMKKKAKAKIQEQSSGSGQYSNGTTVIIFATLRNTFNICFLLNIYQIFTDC